MTDTKTYAVGDTHEVRGALYTITFIRETEETVELTLDDKTVVRIPKSHPVAFQRAHRFMAPGKYDSYFQWAASEDAVQSVGDPEDPIDGLLALVSVTDASQGEYCSVVLPPSACPPFGIYVTRVSSDGHVFAAAYGTDATAAEADMAEVLDLNGSQS